MLRHSSLRPKRLPGGFRRDRQSALWGLLSVCVIGALAWVSFMPRVRHWVYNPSGSVAIGGYRHNSIEHAVHPPLAA